MPRVSRVEFEGAVYHISAQGNRRNSIVEDDTDRKRFFETLQEVVTRCDWEVYSWVLMDDHYQFVIRTPEPNLVRGMSWFQNTITKRYNAHHQQQGHLFAGRYKAILVEEGEALINTINYVNLAPARYMDIALDRDQLFQWGSLSDYIAALDNRSEFSNIDIGLDLLGFADTAKGRDKFWKKMQTVFGTEEVAYKSYLRAGWLAGSGDFEREMRFKLRYRERDKRYYERRKFEESEELAQEIIDSGLANYGLTREDLLKIKKSDWRKVEMALEIRKKTTMNADWVGEHLHMGTRGGISNAIRKYQEGS